MRSSEGRAGGLLLLFCLLALSLAGNVPALSFSASNPAEKDIFVEVSGHVKHAGVYAFKSPPTLQDLVIRGGGINTAQGVPFPKESFSVTSGSRVWITRDLNHVRARRGKMSAFYRLTLGIPLNVNRESAEGLTAVSGIGPKKSKAIVDMRKKSGRFKSLTELVRVRGIGPKVYEKISPHLVLEMSD